MFVIDDDITRVKYDHNEHGNLVVTGSYTTKIIMIPTKTPAIAF